MDGQIIVLHEPRTRSFLRIEVPENPAAGWAVVSSTFLFETHTWCFSSAVIPLELSELLGPDCQHRTPATGLSLLQKRSQYWFRWISRGATGTAGRNSTRVMVFPADERVITGDPQLWRRRKNKIRGRRRIVGIRVLHFWPPSVPQDKRFRANKGLCWPSCVSGERRQSQIYGTLRLVRAGTKTGQADG